MSQRIQNAVLTVVLAANPQLFDLVLPVIIVVAVILWLLPNWQQHQRQ